jgi:PX-associated
MPVSNIQDPKLSPASTVYEDAQETLVTDLLIHNEEDDDLTPNPSSKFTLTNINQGLIVTPSDGSKSFNKLHASPVSDLGPSANEGTTTSDDSALTPLRAHYLKKSLVTLQFSKELLGFSDMDPGWPTLSPLSYLGAPFTPAPKGAPALQLPFLRFMFRQFVLTFPFLASTPKDFFPGKLQPFVGSLISRNLSTTDDILGMDEPNHDPELRSRQKIIAKTEKYFSLILGSALKLTEPEEVVRLTQRDLDRLEVLARRRAAKAQRARDLFDVNIICVRTVVEKGRVRSRIHEEFVIRTRRSGWQDILVSRRYGDFKTLADEVRVTFRPLYSKN